MAVDINGTIIMYNGRNFEPWQTEKTTQIIKSLLFMNKHIPKHKMTEHELEMYTLSFTPALDDAIKLLFMASNQLDNYTHEIADEVIYSGEAAFNRIVAQYQLI